MIILKKKIEGRERVEVFPELNFPEKRGHTGDF
jgi:hypothetical protein